MDPELQLRTLYVLDDRGRSLRTREPGNSRPSAFALVRSIKKVAWAIGADVPNDLAAKLDELAVQEPPARPQTPPIHGGSYVGLVGGRVEFGPAFEFPDEIAPPEGVVLVEDPDQLRGGFDDMVDEYEGRSPIFAVLEEGKAVSICHCARRSDEAAEAGLYTLEPHRGRDFGPRVTAAWGLAIRASGRIPLYSTSWTNASSIAVANKVGLMPYASDWSVSG